MSQRVPGDSGESNELTLDAVCESYTCPSARYPHTNPSIHLSKHNIHVTKACGYSI